MTSEVATSVFKYISEGDKRGCPGKLRVEVEPLTCRAELLEGELTPINLTQVRSIFPDIFSRMNWESP